MNKSGDAVRVTTPLFQEEHGGSIPTSPLHVAHQRRIREREALADQGDMFGQHWREKAPEIGTAIVREISVATATEIILRYEWLGTMPAIVLGCFGIYFDGELGGAVVYSPEYAANLGVWDRYGYTDKLILLSRGACVHWAHPHAASKLIRRSMVILPPQYRVITATVDASAGEVGTIYQACGFDYVGVMSKGGRRATLQQNGSRGSARQAYRDHGTRGVKGLRAIGLDVEAVARKGRYFGFRGTPAEVAELRRPVLNKIKPYPKRLATLALLAVLLAGRALAAPWATAVPTRTPYPTSTPTPYAPPPPTPTPWTTPTWTPTPVPTPSGAPPLAPTPTAPTAPTTIQAPNTYNLVTFSCAPPMAPCAPLVLQVKTGGQMNVTVSPRP